MGGTFDNVDQGAVVWGEYAGFGWLESLEWWCSGFFECILLGPGDPDHGCFLSGVMVSWFLQPWCLERVV